MDFSGPSQATGIYLEEVVVKRTRQVIYILVNSDEKQVIAKTSELFDVECMCLQAGKVTEVWEGGLLGLWVFFWNGFGTVV